jgi:hypothetical protein
MVNRPQSDLQHELVSGLKASLAESTKPPDAYAQALNLLRSFADEVQSSLAKGHKAHLAGLAVNVERGHVVNLGVEHRVVINAPEAGISDVLLRAYLPVDGLPVTLDILGDEDQECKSQEELVQALVAIPRHPAIAARLRIIRQVLGDPALQQEAKVVGPVKKKRG